MNLNKNLSQEFTVVLVIIIIATFIVRWFWTDIKKLVGGDYQGVTISQTLTTVDKNLKQKVLLQLEKLRQYGEWPIPAVRENPDRGDIFTPKENK